MQTLGERLQEARQRLGVTLREAAEFTKIRTDYLQSMEANQFESIPLADVYKRGFVKVYASTCASTTRRRAPISIRTIPPRLPGVRLKRRLMKTLRSSRFPVSARSR
jgi:hypothetical protein